MSSEGGRRFVNATHYLTECLASERLTDFTKARVKLAFAVGELAAWKEHLIAEEKSKDEAERADRTSPLTTDFLPDDS